MLDTVGVAEKDPDREQPWSDLGLKADEYARIKEILGRRPTSSELAMYSVMWSEHCSYKSSKVHLRQFSEIPQETPLASADGSPGVGKMLAGIGENAGVVDIGQGYAVTFKIESHNHPSYVEPYQGAATGVGGIVRDILAMGARPVAVMDPLRFGPLSEPDTHRVLPGIVAGVGGYGNCLGLPNIGGEAVFDASLPRQPARQRPVRRRAAPRGPPPRQGHRRRQPGRPVRRPHRRRRHRRRLACSRRETFAADGPAKRPSVQVGDPFMEKLLIECTLELFAAGIVTGIQDLGGAGLSCATSELASAGDGGMQVELDRVPLRDSSLAPEEILMSESQERMMAVVEPEDVEQLMAICAKWDVEAVVVGEVTDTGRLRIDWHGEQVVDVPPRSVAHDGPTYHRPFERPDWQDALQGDAAEGLAPSGQRRRAARDAAPPRRQREPLRQVLDHRPVRPLRPRRHRARAAQRQRDDPRRRGDRSRGLGRDRLQRPVREARPVRRRAAGARRGLPQRGDRRGASPLAVSDCLNFGSPEDPAVMWQFAEACRGLKDGCIELGIPVTGGNVSLYNQTGETAILPTPVVAVLGVMDDVRRRTPSAFGAGGDAVYLLGETRAELSGSEWAHVVHGHLGGLPPTVDLQAERALASLLHDGVGLLTSAHDLSDGGLAQTWPKPRCATASA